ncbi:MAG: hypothetical protein IPM94_13985 [bacterium]|nr:hypothetical protein [bacterium]
MADRFRDRLPPGSSRYARRRGAAGERAHPSRRWRLPLGFDATAAQIATQALLEAALADTARAVLDPAVLGGASRGRGPGPAAPRPVRPGPAPGSFAAGEATLVEMITRDPDQIVWTSDDDARRRAPCPGRR